MASAATGAVSCAWSARSASMHPLEVYLQLLPLALSEGAAATGSVSGALALSQMLGRCGRILVHPMLLAPTQVLGRRGWVANRRRRPVFQGWRGCSPAVVRSLRSNRRVGQGPLDTCNFERLLVDVFWWTHGSSGVTPSSDRALAVLSGLAELVCVRGFSHIDVSQNDLDDSLRKPTRISWLSRPILAHCA